MSELKDRTAKGLFWGGMSNGVQQLLNLFFGIFLARLLSPAEYGTVGMLAIFSAIASALQESGLIAALINRKESRAEDYNSVFWFSVSISFVLYAILWFCAPLIADFFHTPVLVPLSRFCFLSFVISSFGIPFSAYLSKHLMIREKAIASIVALLFSGTTGVIMAANGCSYWGIATQSIVYVLVVVICQVMFSPWRPKLSFSINPIKEMLPFGIKMLITKISNIINNNIFSVILGRFYTEVEVGNYSNANKWNGMGYTLISGMVSSVAQPVLVEAGDDDERQLRVLRKMVRFTALVSFPALFGLALIAPEFITVTITDKWAESAKILRVLAVGGAFIPLSELLANLVISRGDSNSYMWCTMALGISQIIIILLMRRFGIFPMILASTALNILWVFLWYYMAARKLSYSFPQFVNDTLPFCAIALAVMAVTYFIVYKIENVYFLLVAKILVAAVLYLLLMVLFKSKTFAEGLSYITRKNKK